MCIDCVDLARITSAFNALLANTTQAEFLLSFVGVNNFDVHTAHHSKKNNRVYSSNAVFVFEMHNKMDHIGNHF